MLDPLSVVNLNKYRTIIFDCDGVLLNSNFIKSDAFYAVAIQYGEKVANVFLKYHKNNGGISRFEKFKYLLNVILKKEAEEADVKRLCAQYSDQVLSGLMLCDVAEGLDKLRVATASLRWAIVSGGYQQELRNVFSTRGLSEFFDAGIYGSPDNKDQIVAREIKSKNFQEKALFLGDSKYDHLTASKVGFDFLFVSEWTEFSDWRKYCFQKNIKSINRVSDLLNY